MTSPGSDRVESPSPRPGTRSAGCGGPASSSSRTAATLPQIERPELFLEALGSFLDGPSAGAESAGSHAG